MYLWSEQRALSYTVLWLIYEEIERCNKCFEISWLFEKNNFCATKFHSFITTILHIDPDLGRQLTLDAET